MSDSEKEDEEVKPKRAKITDTDNEDDDQKSIDGGEKPNENVPREDGGGSSDEGVRNDDVDDQGFVEMLVCCLRKYM